VSRTALRVLVLVTLLSVLSLAAVSTASAAVCPGGPGSTCIELRVNNPPVSTNTPTFTDGATVQTWPTPGIPGCLPDVTPNWSGPLVTMDAIAPVAPPIQTCYNNGALWTSSGRDTGGMAGSQCINDLENVAFESPAGKLFTSVSIELQCLGPATRLHDVQVYYYISPGVLCEQQLIEPPLYAAKPHGAPGVNSYILATVPSDTLCAAGFRRIEIEPQIGSACSVVNTNDFRTASAPSPATQVWSTTGVQGGLPDVTPNGPGALVDVEVAAPNAALICGAPDAHLSLAKTANPTTYSTVGDVINYTVVATNDGSATLSGVSISDPTVGALNCTPAQPAALAPGASLSCTGSHTVTQADLAAGSIVNTANAAGTSPSGPVSSLPATATVNAVPTCFATADNGTTVFASATAHAVQQAVDAATAGGTVKVAGTCVGVESRAGTDQSVYIDKVLTLAGGYATSNWTTSLPLTQPTILDAAGAGRVIYASQDLTVTDMTLQGGKIAGNGGGVYSAGALTLTHVSVLSCTATGLGGGVYVNGAAQFDGGVIESNSSSAQFGGGFWANSSLVLTDTDVLSNTAQNSAGGGIVIGTAVLHGGLFINNQSTGGGAGALYANGSVDLTGTQFINNRGLNGGAGALFLPNGSSTIVNALFAGNTAANPGAAIQFVSPGNLTILYTTITSPTLNSKSAIAAGAGTVNIKNTIISGHAIGVEVTG
jgi:uncharacterized repeat protein (TIGR01451 family)